MKTWKTLFSSVAIAAAVSPLASVKAGAAVLGSISFTNNSSKVSFAPTANVGQATSITFSGTQPTDSLGSGIFSAIPIGTPVTALNLTGLDSVATVNNFPPPTVPPTPYTAGGISFGGFTFAPTSAIKLTPAPPAPSFILGTQLNGTLTGPGGPFLGTLRYTFIQSTPGGKAIFSATFDASDIPIPPTPGTIPEPSSVMGVITLGILGLGSAMKKRLQK